MKIYTKKGDSGSTSLIGGTRVPKHHLRIEAYGTVDEVNAYIGLIRDQSIPGSSEKLLKDIQNCLFILGSTLAEDPKGSKMELPKLRPADIEVLEKAIDEMNDELPELRNFILPGGHTIVSYCHIARCVCRRAERLAVALEEEEGAPEQVIPYLNRLSDFLFILGRYFAHTLGAKEYLWAPRT